MSSPAQAPDGVVASAVEVVEIEEAARLLEARAPVFSAGELAYAKARSDPARRLAARLAAKRAVLRLLGGGLVELDIEVVRGELGPPALALSPSAESRLRELGGVRALVSLTHERSHAAALVLLLAPS